MDIEVSYLSAAERARWVATVQPVVDEYWAKLDPSVAKEMKACADAANKAFPGK